MDQITVDKFNIIGQKYAFDGIYDYLMNRARNFFILHKKNR